jgi:hypothetical protein
MLMTCPAVRLFEYGDALDHVGYHRPAGLGGGTRIGWQKPALMPGEIIIVADGCDSGNA